MLLHDAEVHVWVIRLDTLAGIEDDLTLLSAPEHDRAGRLRSDRDRSRFLRRRLALRRILGAYLNVEPRAIEYRLNRFGKPSLAPAPSGQQMSFNTSHSNGVAAVAVARSLQIGIDIECIKPIPEAEAIAAHYFTACEMATLTALPPHQRIAGFYNGWTRKEAIVKALGGGLSIPLDSFEVSLKPGDPARILYCTREASGGQTLHLHNLELCSGYAAALASTAAPQSIRLGVYEQPGE
jgi:4'-phosphopantetheinyl transferase